MYTHCRQFPHLQNRTDNEIRALVQRAMNKRPKLRLILRARNVVVIAIMIFTAMLYLNIHQQELGNALMLAGGLATLIVLIWNFVWVNWVLFRITAEELND